MAGSHVCHGRGRRGGFHSGEVVLRRTGAAGLGAALTAIQPAQAGILEKFKGSPLEDLGPMTDDVVPITLEERKARIAKAQELMTKHSIDMAMLAAAAHADSADVRPGADEVIVRDVR